MLSRPFLGREELKMFPGGGQGLEHLRASLPGLGGHSLVYAVMPGWEQGPARGMQCGVSMGG